MENNKKNNFEFDFYPEKFNIPEILPHAKFGFEERVQQEQIQLNVVDLFTMAFPDEPPTISRALSRPSFCLDPKYSTYFVCGTEEQIISKKGKNYLIFGNCENGEVHVRFTYQISDAVRDLIWWNAQNLILAMGSRLFVAKMNDELQVVQLLTFPEFHKDIIREIAIFPGESTVISGGFDGNVFITNISKICSAIENKDKKSENSLYLTKEVVSSVGWHIEDPNIATCATDNGVFHLFDIRSGQKRSIVYDTKKEELYCHCFKDSNTVLMGYGDGQISVFDIRKKKCVNDNVQFRKFNYW